LTANDIREITSMIVEQSKPDSLSPLEIRASNLKLTALMAMMVGEIAAQLADLNENFVPKNSEFGPN